MKNFFNNNPKREEDFYTKEVEYYSTDKKSFVKVKIPYYMNIIKNDSDLNIKNDSNMKNNINNKNIFTTNYNKKDNEIMSFYDDVFEDLENTLGNDFEDSFEKEFEICNKKKVYRKTPYYSPNRTFNIPVYNINCKDNDINCKDTNCDICKDNNINFDRKNSNTSTETFYDNNIFKGKEYRSSIYSDNSFRDNNFRNSIYSNLSTDAQELLDI